jgi:hypothetical protein
VLQEHLHGQRKSLLTPFGGNRSNVGPLSALASLALLTVERPFQQSCPDIGCMPILEVL